MKFSKLGLLTLLISLFILSSCKNQDSIGLGVDAGSQLNGTLMVDSNILVTTLPEDTIATGALSSTLSRTVLSYFKDPELGITEGNIAAGITLPSGIAYTLPTGTITIDSSILVLPYTNGFYGDSLTSKFKLDVHRLNEPITNGTAYYNNKAWAYDAAVIGTKTFTARTHDTIKILNILKGRSDTLIKVAPQLRIPISQAFVNTYLLGDEAAAFRLSTTAFQNAVKGLYLTFDKNATTGPGGNIPFNLDSLRISVYYKVNNAGVIDTAMTSMPVIINTHAVQIKHTYSAKVQAALNNTSTTGLFYLQGGAGLRAKITFPNVKNTFSNVGNVVINRAELIIKPAPGTTIPYRPSQRLTMYTSDLAKQRIRIPDASTADARGQNAGQTFGGYYNSATGEYHFTVTGFIQDLISGKITDNGTYIAPVNPVSSTTSGIDIAPTAQYTERLISFGKNNPSRIKLNIIYTKINK
ncbi:DUF4270 family protein [Mucilaginibacter glaciei]|uniref:DUF4270 family protein n=1 Tax=Mucilaginibacter glaciei TaxID=2772109 RepID=A0A926NM85_9SPHI|nr:DUF4270 family protein [Mucilaginibacter glaciei]MBD1393756.1 DUF4270 family protein [Mucilaginibacter glaciei]